MTVFTINSLILSTLLAAGACTLLVLWTSSVAGRIGLVDRPTQRKQHVGEVPIVGGLCIYLAALLSLSVVYSSLSVVLPLLVGAGLVVLGVIDDRVGLSTLVRFPVQVATAIIMISVGQVSIDTVGNLFGQGPVVMGTYLSMAFTVVCTVGVINSINMIDGVDGLSGSIVGITLATLTYFCYLAGDMASVALLLALLSANLVFLMFNSRLMRSRALVFMGDAGSTLFGFLLVWYFIRLTQGENAVLSPVAAGWIFGLPLLDTIAVMVRRVLSGRSPFDADRQHLHHRLLDTGLTPNQVVLCMALAQIGFVLIGLMCNASVVQHEPFFFWLFVLLVVAHFFLTPRALVAMLRSTPHCLSSDRHNGSK